MTDLLLSETPPLPPGSNHPRAVVLEFNYTYNDLRLWIPAALRNQVPQQSKTDGVLLLYKGEEGFIYSQSPDGNWGLVLIIRAGVHLHVVIPTSYLTVGESFRPLLEKLTINAPSFAPDPSEILVPSDVSIFEKYVRKMWELCAQRPDDFARFGLPHDIHTSLFSHAALQTNFELMLRGLIPEVLNAIQNGDFSIRDLLRLPHVTKDTKDCRPGVYLRLYTHLDVNNSDPHNAGGYVGHTRQGIWNRHCQHEEATVADTTSLHYKIAMKAKPSNRYTIPLCLWENSAVEGLSDEFLELVEQTFVLLFRTYHGVLYDPLDDNSEEKPKVIMNSTRASYLRDIGRAAYRIAGWNSWQHHKPRGCNVSSPIFDFRQTVVLTCHRMQPKVPGVRTFTTYRKVPATRICGGLIVVDFNFRDGKGARDKFDLYLPKCVPATIDRAKWKSYIVFEIMDDGKRHEKPWLAFPSVGTFQIFERASSLGIRFEWLDETQGRWFSIPISRSELNDRKSKGSYEGILALWRRAMTLIQLLEGITWAGPLNGLDNGASLGKTKVMELSTNHLGQTLAWIQRPRKVCPAPVLATWNENFVLMEEQFGGDFTLVGPSQPPPHTDGIWRVDDSDNMRLGVLKKLPCDLCVLSKNQYNQYQNRCERDESRTDVWVCKFCSLLNRPCTFTPPSISRQCWGSTPPFINRMSTAKGVYGLGWSSYPTGPHRFLAVHHAIPEAERQTPMPIDPPFEYLCGQDVDEELSDEELDRNVNEMNSSEGPHEEIEIFE